MSEHETQGVDQEPRTFVDLADHARDVQEEARKLQVPGTVLARNASQRVVALSWQVERLAAQFAEACERLADQEVTT